LDMNEQKRFEKIATGTNYNPLGNRI